MLFYSQETGGFYSSVVHKNSVPVDAIEITASQHQALLAGLASGQHIVVSNGVIDLESIEIDRTALERAWRDGELACITWLRERHRDQLDLQRPTTLSPEQFVELLTYMQSLRDWPQAGSFPVQTERPTRPDWLYREI